MDNKETNEINLVSKMKIGETQINNSLELQNVNETKITKVLTINANPVVERIDVLNGEVKINGFVEYDLLLALENNEINSTTEKSAFSVVFEDKNILENSIVDVISNIVEVNNVGNEELSFNSVINLKIYLTSVESPIQCPEEIEGVFVKTKEIFYSSFINKVFYNFNVSFEETKDSRFNKVLYSTSNATIKSIVPANDYFVVNGEVFTSIVYQNEDGLIKNVVKENDFSEEIEIKCVNKDSIVQLKILTKEVEVVENLENKTFNFLTPIELVGEVFERKTCKTILDAYSLTNQVNLTTTSFEDQIFYSTKLIDGAISTSAVIDENLEPIDKILAVVPTNVSIINEIVNDNCLLLEGIVSLNIVYYSLDNEGGEVLNSFDVDVPYSLNFSIDELNDSYKSINQLIVRDVNVKTKQGKELEIFIDFKLNTNLISNSSNAVVSKIDIGEEKQLDDCSLQIYLTRDEETLWDIAKRMNVTVEDLIKQNGELVMPIQNGEKIVSYKQRNIDFE